MSEFTEQTRQLRQWVEKAENDLINAEHTLTLKDNCPFDTICFHAQQCAEKYLKALLFHRLIQFPKTHDLRVLIQLAPEDIRGNLAAGEILKLNRYSVEARYPDDWEPFTREEAECAVAIARQVRAEVRKNLPPEALDD